MRQNPLVSKYNQEVSAFFGLSPIDIEVHLLGSRAEFDEVLKRKTYDWEVGHSKGRVIYVLDKDVFETESSHPASDFEKVLKHEISHVYFDILRPDTTPYWLSEGIACYLAGQNKMRPENEITIELLKYYHKNVDKKVYGVGRYVVDQVVDKCGKQKLLELIKQDDTEKLYEELQNIL